MLRTVLLLTATASIVGSASVNAEVLKMSHGQVQIRDLRAEGFPRGDIVNVHLGNNEVAEVIPVSTTKVVITAKALGTTSMILTDANHNVITHDTIVVNYPSDDRIPVRVRTFGKDHVSHIYACDKESGCELNRVGTQEGSALRAPTPAEIAAAVAGTAPPREAQPSPGATPPAGRR
jgi:hypothetical protein